MSAATLRRHATPGGTEYLDSGSGDAGVLVLTHGWRDSAEGWESTLAALGDSRWRFVSVQRSEADRDDDDSAGLLEDFAAQIVDVVDHATDGTERLVLVGQSMGGAVAELAAVQLAPRVKGLVLVNPAPLVGFPLPEEAVENFLKTARVLDRETAGSLRAAFAIDQSDHIKARITASTPPESERASVQSVLSWIHGHPRGLERSSIDAPVLLVVSDNQFFSEPMLVQDVAPRFTNVDIAKIAGTGHYPHLERPRELGELINGFTEALAR